MGTNYYARVIPKEDKKNELINAVVHDNFDKVIELANELYGSKGEYEESGGQIHLGKNSYGWSFLWNPNVYYYCDGYFGENKEYVPVWKHKFTYPLTKQGITDFVMQENVYIVDEYGEIQNKQEFLDWVFTKEGLSHKEYYNSSEYNGRYIHRDDKQTIEKWTSLGYEPEYGEFFADGLRFSTFQNFS